jgi:hypothetical protein
MGLGHVLANSEEAHGRQARPEGVPDTGGRATGFFHGQKHPGGERRHVRNRPDAHGPGYGLFRNPEPTSLHLRGVVTPSLHLGGVNCPELIAMNYQL